MITTDNRERDDAKSGHNRTPPESSTAFASGAAPITLPAVPKATIHDVSTANRAVE